MGAAAGGSRETILDAARELFARQGFQRTTTRSVAAHAGVDAAMVHYFFGTKAELFAAVIELPVPTDELRTLIGAGGPQLGVRVARFFLERVFTERNHAIAAMLRAVIADPESVPALRARLEQSVVALLVPALPGKHRRLRAELMGAQFVGLFLMRHVVQLEPVASASVSALAELLGRAIETYLRDPAITAAS